MADLDLLQASFSGGEIAPALYARTNIEKYQSAAKKLKNFSIKVHGGIDKRGGSFFLDEAKNNLVPSRLIKFQFSENEGYALEFGENIMRVFTFDGLVLNDDNATVFELVTPYDIDEVWQMKTEQSADIIFMFHPSHHPKMLKRFAHNDWKIEDMVFEPQTLPPKNLKATAKTAGTNFYKYKVTAISEATGEESLPAEASTTSAELSSANVITISWNAVEGCKKYSVYRYSNGMYGWISTTVSETEIIDNNVKIDFNVTPPTSRNPFDGVNKYPSTGGIHEQRMAMAATYDDPEAIEISKPSNYKNFTMSNPLLDDDAISLKAAGLRLNTIYDFISLNELLLTTANGIWKVTSSRDANFLTPKSGKVKRQNYYQCQNIKPLIVGNVALYMESNRVRTLGYSLESDGYDGNDVSIFAAHLFEGREVVAWDYVAKSSQVLFSYDDGMLACLTFVPEHQLFAFSRFETNGWFESICTVKSQGKEAIFAVVVREINGQIKRYVERFVINSQPIENRNDDFLFLDCASELNSENEFTTILGLDYLEGCSVGVWADGGYKGEYVVVGGKITLESPVKNAKVGLLYEAELHTLGVDYPASNLSASAQGKSKKIASVVVNVAKSGYFEAGVVDDGARFSEAKMRLQKYGTGSDLVDGNIRIDLFGGYNERGEIIIKQSHPSPLTINAIIPEVVHGG